MRLCFSVLAAAITTAFVLLACGGQRHATAPDAASAPTTSTAATNGRDPASPSPVAGTVFAGAAAPTPPSTAPARQARPDASLSLIATLSVSLAGSGGSYTYRFNADGVPVALDSDGTFDSMAPIDATLLLSANGCTWNLHLVNPQIDVGGSVSADGSTLRVASIRVSQDDVAGDGACVNAAQPPPAFAGIGAGTTNLSPATPIAVPFRDGVSAGWPRPGAVERYPHSVTAEWNGTLRLSVPDK